VGIPHSVAFLQSEEAVEALDLKVIGPPLENHPLLNDPLSPERTNVEFAYPRSKREVRMRVWEYAVGETLACGSGSCATAVAAMRHGLAESPIRLLLDGGSVEVEWEGEGGPMYTTGPAEYVCEGKLLS
jgi:diaminopimelate epimerase